MAFRPQVNTMAQANGQNVGCAGVCKIGAVEIILQEGSVQNSKGPSGNNFTFRMNGRPWRIASQLVSPTAAMP